MAGVATTVAITAGVGRFTNASATKTITTGFTTQHHMVAITVTLLVALATAEAAETAVNVLVLCVGQRGTRPNKALRHKRQCFPSGDFVKSGTFEEWS